MILAHDVIPETKEASENFMAHKIWRQESPGRGPNWSNMEQYEYKNNNDANELKHIMCYIYKFIIQNYTLQDNHHHSWPRNKSC